ncbi:hypothetical protein DSL72_004959 [Monilinia vaccinii-corymbosi]|uniref:Thioesterase domain-containing protein n=1 Tax=Monilinia vaccinii-corymbosi TaxID=61207 RepID=A0A8A3P500_9HELO|nr:hypothetical protein DSL72_004959 [Monilinia vaccinii-corymbosi]
MSFPTDLYPFAPIPKETTEHFSSVPWCRRYLEDQCLHPFPSESRIRKKSTRHTLTAITLQTPDTMPFVQLLYSPPSPSRPFGEIKCLLSLGTLVNGHVDIAHGGFMGVLLDDLIGCAAHTATVGDGDQARLTAYLNITYRKPVRTPGVVLGRSWVERREGRKVFGKATIEDGKGMVLTSAEGLFVSVDVEKLRGKL